MDKVGVKVHSGVLGVKDSTLRFLGPLCGWASPFSPPEAAPATSCCAGLINIAQGALTRREEVLTLRQYPPTLLPTGQLFPRAGQNLLGLPGVSEAGPAPSALTTPSMTFCVIWWGSKGLHPLAPATYSSPISFPPLALPDT